MVLRAANTNGLWAHHGMRFYLLHLLVFHAEEVALLDRKKKSYYLLFVSFRFNRETSADQVAALEAFVGKQRSGSGFGLGMRDIDFTFTTKEERDAVMKKVQDKFPLYAVRSLDGDDE